MDTMDITWTPWTSPGQPELKVRAGLLCVWTSDLSLIPRIQLFYLIPLSVLIPIN